MKYFFAYYLLASCVLAAYFSIRKVFEHGHKYTINRIMAACCMSSAIWSLGFGALILQTDTHMAYLCRNIGMVGTFGFLISAQLLTCHISGINPRLRYWFDGFSLLGIPIYFLTIQPDVTVYKLEHMGMTYHFQSGLPNNIYTIYCVLVSSKVIGKADSEVWKAASYHAFDCCGRYDCGYGVTAYYVQQCDSG